MKSHTHYYIKLVASSIACDDIAIKLALREQSVLLMFRKKMHGDLITLITCASYPEWPQCPEWPRRQCVGLVFRRSQVRTSLSAVSLVICSPARIAVCPVWISSRREKTNMFTLVFDKSLIFWGCEFPFA